MFLFSDLLLRERVLFFFLLPTINWRQRETSHGGRDWVNEIKFC
ncbi:hypothetical protein GLYMA_08G194450v4 [Glycine max]|nr:hypothetical protein GLYMA_08G194450v4 [Glycine max]KAH1052059.1 hypothetical protein GYH30_021762 [Glycine max]